MKPGTILSSWCEISSLRGMPAADGASKSKPDSAANAVGVVAVATQLPVVANIGRYRFGPVHTNASVNHRTVVTQARTKDRYRITGNVHQTGRYRYSSLIEIMFPRCSPAYRSDRSCLCSG